MKTVTIRLDNELAHKIEALAKQEGQPFEAMVLRTISRGLSEQARRKAATKTLEAIFSEPVPPPFNTMTEEEILQVVDEEIQAVRQGVEKNSIASST